MQACADLTEPNPGESSERYTNYLIDTYFACAMRHDTLVKFNTPKLGGI